MASGTIKTYGRFPLALLDKKVDFDNDTIKAILTTTSHTADQDAGSSNTPLYADALTNEVSGTGYTTGGLTVTGKVLSYNSSTNAVKIVIDDIVYTTVTLTNVKNIHLVDSTPGSAATNPLMMFAVIDNALNPDAGNLTFDTDATNGILQIVSS